MQSVSAELAEQLWEETHAQALLFAQKLASTRYELSLPKSQNVMFSLSPPSSKPGSPENTTTAHGGNAEGSSEMVLSLSDFYASDREMSAPLPGSRAGSPSSSRPFSRHDLRVQTPKAVEFMGDSLDLGEISQRSMDSLDSNMSLLTSSSLGSLGSGLSSVIPFPFREPPRIPHVDAFARNGLKYADIKKGARVHESADHRRRRHRRRGQRAGHDQEAKESYGAGQQDEDFQRTQQEQEQEQEQGPASASSSVTSLGSSSATEQKNGDDRGTSNIETFTTEQIDAVMAYFQSFAPVDKQRSGVSGSYEITLIEFDAALRKHARTLVTAEDEKLAHSLLTSLDWLLKKLALTPLDWFKATDSRGGTVHGDNKLTLRELEAGIDNLCDRVGMPHWRRKDVHFMLRQIDPNGDGDLSAAELCAAMAQLDQPPVTISTLKQAGPVIRRIHKFLKRKAMKVRDVFNLADKDGSASLSAPELRRALHSIFQLPPPTHAQSVAAAAAAHMSVGESSDGVTGVLSSAFQPNLSPLQRAMAVVSHGKGRDPTAEARGIGHETVKALKSVKGGKGLKDGEGIGTRRMTMRRGGLITAHPAGPSLARSHKLGEGRRGGMLTKVSEGMVHASAKSTLATLASIAPPSFPGVPSIGGNRRGTSKYGGLHQSPIARLVPLPVEMKETVDRYDRLVRGQIALLFPETRP